ncbi:MAG: hypothetical protein MGG37_04225 [Trichodesmium sp. MAG_R01]|nr:hypothetical protein [Trichodesmium sp. MAG_R01]
MIPHDLPPYTTVYRQILLEMAALWFLATSRPTSPPKMKNTIRYPIITRPLRSLILNYQNNRKNSYVYDFNSGKNVIGPKRHIVVDSQGSLIRVLVSEANASEALGAVVVLKEVRISYQN